MAKLLLKGVRYIRCYSELTFWRPNLIRLKGTIDYCVDRPILMAPGRGLRLYSWQKILQAGPRPKRSLEIGTNYGGTLFLLCALSPARRQDHQCGPAFRAIRPVAIPVAKAPLFSQICEGRPRSCTLFGGDSHSPETKEGILRILDGEQLDYLFLDGDHTYCGVQRDFQMYAPLVRSGGNRSFSRHRNVQARIGLPGRKVSGGEIQASVSTSGKLSRTWTKGRCRLQLQVHLWTRAGLGVLFMP